MSLRNGSASGGRFGAFGGSLSGNGACIVFTSDSDDLVTGGYGSDFEHVFLRAFGAACPGAASPPPRDKTPPVISNLSLTHKRFAVGTRPTALSAANRKRMKKHIVRGTVFTFTLSEPATTRIAITQKVNGDRASRKGRASSPPRREAQLHSHCLSAHAGASAQP